MRFIVNDAPIGELFFSMPQQEELIIAQEQVSEFCRNAINNEKNERLEYELEQMKRTKTAYHFLVLKEIASLSKEKGYPIMFNGSMGGSYISFLLGISPFNPSKEPYISSELIWSLYDSCNTPDFEISISPNIRSLIQKRLDEKFGFVKDNNSLFYQLRITDCELCDCVFHTDVDMEKYDTSICTAIMQRLFPETANITCDFKQLVNIYAYKCGGSFSADVSLDELLGDDVIVTRDKLYFELVSNNVPSELAVKVVKKGVWSPENKKREYILQLEKYSLPENVLSAFKNANHLWDVASCISRLYIQCQKEYESRIEDDKN